MFLATVNHELVGRVLGKSVFTGNGSTLLAAGTMLTLSYVDRLLELGYNRVYLLDGQFDDVEMTDSISAVTRGRALSVMAGLAGAAGDESEVSRRMLLAPLAQVVDSITQDVMASPLTVAACADLKSFDEYTFYHCVNTCVICLQLGRKANLSRDRLRDLGYAALLHDVGKLQLPIALLNKPGRLDPVEFAEIQTHSQLGWESLKSYRALGAVARSGTLQHHERYDGKGYPKGLAGLDICWVARYITVADVFDALTSDRPYRRALSNSVVLAELMPLGDPAFDPEILSLLHKVVCPYPPGTAVTLSDGSVAVVIRVSEDDLASPLVRIAGGDGRAIDLAECDALSIVGVA